MNIFFACVLAVSRSNESITGTRKMQPSVEGVICFTWREIEAGGVKCRVRHDTASESNNGEGISDEFLDNAVVRELEDTNDHRNGRGQLGVFDLGGELPGSQWMVHGSIPRTMLFSNR